MVYYGRILGIGISADGKPTAVYGLTGRSSASKQRIARVIDDDFIPRIRIESSGKPDICQKKQANLLFYDAIIAFNDLFDGTPYLAISNGCHTNHIADRTAAWPLKDDSMLLCLENMGYEPDSLRTPRIAGEIRFHRTGLNCPSALIGIITENQIDAEKFMMHRHDIGSGEGGVKVISTYDGKNDDKPTAPFWPNSLEDAVRTINLHGHTPKEIADSFYEVLDKRYVVSTAAAVWNDGKWDLAVKNLHETE